MVWLVSSPDPIFSSSFDRLTQSVVSKNHLKQIGLALHQYHDAQSSFPAGGTFNRDGRPIHSAMTVILPFLQQQELYASIDLTVPWNHASNQVSFSTWVPEYQYPDRNSPKQSNDNRSLAYYAGNVHVMQLGTGRTLESISDGRSQTILFGEVTRNFRPWGDPLNVRDPASGINKNPQGFGSPFGQGVNFLMADGSVSYISEDISPEILRALGTPDAGDVVDDNNF